MSAAAQVAAAIAARQSFILTSHARPDGDAVGSQLALALALEALGKSVRLVDRDPVPEPYRVFPHTGRIELADRIAGAADAIVLLECSDPKRPELAGLDGGFLINIDHHPGNTMYGAVNWFDGTAAACGEMVADVIDALGVPWTPDIAAHLYLAIATDTGGFRFGFISARTFDICRRIVLAGADPAALSRLIFDSYSLGRVKLTGRLLAGMELHDHCRIAVLYIDDAVLAACGATMDESEGLVNLPLSATEVSAVALFKRQAGDRFRVSLRSKGAVDVSAVARNWSGGGHKNAAGLEITGDYEPAKLAVVQAIAAQLGSDGGQTGVRRGSDPGDAGTT
jgi:phosphoesterase RecJ-like protein